MIADLAWRVAFGATCFSFGALAAVITYIVLRTRAENPQFRAKH